MSWKFFGEVKPVINPRGPKPPEEKAVTPQALTATELCQLANEILELEQRKIQLETALDALHSPQPFLYLQVYGGTHSPIQVQAPNELAIPFVEPLLNECDTNLKLAMDRAAKIKEKSN